MVVAPPRGLEDLVLVRGGGDLGTGVAHALHRAGRRVLVLDRPQPTALRLTVSFAAAVLGDPIEVEGVRAMHCLRADDVSATWDAGAVPVWTAGEDCLPYRPGALVDARMRSLEEPATSIDDAPLVIGIGPGFEAGVDCHYLIESNRGPRLGAVIRAGRAEGYTGVPGAVCGKGAERLLRAPRAGVFARRLELGAFVEVGDVVGEVTSDDGSEPVVARLAGMVRGLKLTGVVVGAGHKVGDVDPRRDPALLRRMTDKAQAVGRGVLEALEQARRGRRAG